MTAQHLIDWANRIEGRDDIGYEDGDKGVVSKVIFWLTNPYLNYPIDKEIRKKIKTLFDEL